RPGGALAARHPGHAPAAVPGRALPAGKSRTRSCPPQPGLPLRGNQPARAGRGPVPRGHDSGSPAGAVLPGGHRRGRGDCFPDRALAALTQERDSLEKELVRLLPALKEVEELDVLGPDDLAARLPPGTAFLDLVRRENSQGWQYSAFVLAHGRKEIRRIELGP